MLVTLRSLEAEQGRRRHTRSSSSPACSGSRRARRRSRSTTRRRPPRTVFPAPRRRRSFCTATSSSSLSIEARSTWAGPVTMLLQARPLSVNTRRHSFSAERFPSIRSTRVNRRILLAIPLIAALACGGDRKAAARTRAPPVLPRPPAVPISRAPARPFPYPIYSKWFGDYAADDRREDQLSVDRLRRRHPPAHRGHGRLRRVRRADDGRRAGEGKGADPPLPDRARRRRDHVQPAGAHAAAASSMADAIAQIFAGKITKWNDSRIATLNAGVTLPAKDILVVHRSDGSGTTYIFSDYLSAVSTAWAAAPGKGKELSWPVGIGAKGNEGVAGQVKQTEGAIGYTELAYAKQNKLASAAIANQNGEYVEPSIESATAAAAGIVAKLPPNSDYRISIVNAPGAGAYPISSFTWLLDPEDDPRCEEAEAAHRFPALVSDEGRDERPVARLRAAAAVAHRIAHRSRGLDFHWRRAVTVPGCTGDRRGPRGRRRNAAHSRLCDRRPSVLRRDHVLRACACRCCSSRSRGRSASPAGRRCTSSASAFSRRATGIR